MTIRGEAGALRWGYYPVGTLPVWTIVRDEHGAWSLSGSVVNVDDFKVSQRPLTFVATNGWRWAIQTLQIEGGRLSASLGPKESYESVSRRATGSGTPGPV